jgi:hypothetical protein
MKIKVTWDILLVIGVVSALTAMVWGGISTHLNREQALLEQCLEDGLKEYRCIAILRRGSRWAE